MKFELLYIYTLLSLALVGSHAVSPEVYWKSVLPNSPIPKAINDLLYTEEWDDGLEKVSTSTTSNGEVEDDLQNAAFFSVASKDEVEDDLPNAAFFYVASKDEVKEHLQNQNILVLNSACKDEVKHHPHHDASQNQLKDNSLAKPFLEKDLHEGEEMKLHFMKNDQKTAFLPKNISDLIPFSSKELPEIYNEFSVKHDSKEAKILKQTIDICEHKGVEGEVIFCATSLESMIDFTTTKLGKRVKALSTEVYAKEPTPSQNYKIELVKKLEANNFVVCHRLNYTYAVFYCHKSVGTESYMASLEGADGTKVKSLVVCHTDTSKWDPKHITFQLLKVTPGTATVCHFLPEDHVLWVPY